MVKLPPSDPLICRVAVPVPLPRLFDYLVPDTIPAAQLKPGIRLEVPFGHGTLIGCLMECLAESDIDPARLKSVLRVLDAKPLFGSKDLRLLTWAGQYYHHPIGEVVNTALPAGLRRGNPAVVQVSPHYALTAEGKLLNPDALNRAPKQKALLNWLQSHPQAVSEEQLNSWDKNWRPALKNLLARQLLQPAEPVKYSPAKDKLTREPELVCNADQQHAVDQVIGHLGQFGVFLLQGVTGSGKTEVYLQIIHSVLARGQQVLLLLPEITLTPQLEDRFRKRFAVPIAVSHSKLTDTQRQNAWLSMQSGAGAILLGTRSALFTPLKRPGLLILDEEHDSSFKQQEGFRFSARDVAVARAKLLGVPIVLGSATPSLESLYNVSRGRYQLLHLPYRAGASIEPALHLLDIRNKKMYEGLSEQLLGEIQRTLDHQEQVLLFLNRRGFAPTLICHGCGWVARCGNCDANLVIHYEDHKLRCHHCLIERPLLSRCPDCKSGPLTALGTGTERVEKVLAELFPDKTIIRLDRDSTQRKGALEDYLQQINEGQAQIILGTQMLAKGHHFANVTLVAILDVDSGLFSIDYRGAEKLAQMIVQVSGRAGRAGKPGKVVLQTRHPEHPLLLTLINEGYDSFAQTALAERQRASLPPFSYQALLRAQAASPRQVESFLQTVRNLTDTINSGTIQILGPVAAPMAKKSNAYRYQLLFQHNHRTELHRFLDELLPEIGKLKQARNIRWSLDVDPIDLY